MIERTICDQETDKYDQERSRPAEETTEKVHLLCLAFTQQTHEIESQWAKGQTDANHVDRVAVEWFIDPTGDEHAEKTDEKQENAQSENSLDVFAREFAGRRAARLKTAGASRFELEIEWHNERLR
jgi:hypothetical protein